MHYRAVPIAERRTVTLDDLVLVYHRASGITHLLASPAPEILAALDEGALDLAGLLDRLGRRFDLDAGASGALAARLDELIAAGLVATA
ncbi:MAG: hypothetical protein B7Y45_11610 [Sphingomonas sp. 28-66-16]|nr:MAG: hypothetical protein B7Y45_11610 [Sphingomonas sp. 28-66-16]